MTADSVTATAPAVAAVAPIDRTIPCVVEAIERLLAMAKAGEIASFAMACVLSDGSTASEFSPDCQRARLLGAVDFLHYRMLQNMERAT